MKHGLHFYIKRIDETLDKIASGDLKAAGITMAQARVLEFLRSQPEKTASQKEMETFFCVSHPTISGIVKRMEQSGLVTSTFLRGRRTSKAVTLSKKGEEKYLLAEQNKSSSKKILLKGFTKAETEQLEGMLQKLYANVKGDDEKPAKETAVKGKTGKAKPTASTSSQAAKTQAGKKPAKDAKKDPEKTKIAPAANARSAKKTGK